jgi:hypothetical protein
MHRPRLPQRHFDSAGAFLETAEPMDDTFGVTSC